MLQISTPRNHFRLDASAPHSLLLAGGIGITPILCMAEALAARGAAFSMHYCTRSRQRTAFAGRIAASKFARAVHVHTDDAPVPEFDLPAIIAAAPEGTHIYVCGPAGYIDAVLAAAQLQGWPESRLHYERFSASPQVSTDTDDGPFQVRIASTGQTVTVDAGHTVVQALAEQGIDVLTSCEQGVCGTCLTRVLEGEPEHRDSYLTAEEQAANDQFLPCCSRSRSPLLVLDL